MAERSRAEEREQEIKEMKEKISKARNLNKNSYMHLNLHKYGW